MVTGGVNNSNWATATTELSINEGAWFTVSSSGDLPTPRIGLRCVSLNNKVICTGEKIIIHIMSYVFQGKGKALHIETFIFYKIILQHFF